MLRDTLRRNKGITLIALVVTIIVLLILAGISISMLTGQNGILNRAAEAKEKTGAAQEDESQKLKGYEDTINQYAPSSNGGSTGGGSEGGNPTGGSLPTGTGTTPYLPNSTFSKKEGDLSTGLVIKDSNDNEYVWVEVPKTIYTDTKYNTTGTTIKENEWEKIRDCLKAYTADYASSSYSDTNSKFTKQYQAMLKSVYTNGGFWIGRYEAGLEGDTPRTQYKDILPSDKAVVKQNKIPYNYVKRDEAQTLAQEMDYGDCKGSLIFGIQWDLTLKYIEEKTVELAEEANKDTVRSDIKNKLTSNSTKIGNYGNNSVEITNTNAKYSDNDGSSYTACPNPYDKTSSSNILLTTGADTSFSLMNIYDLAGNICEWTLEFCDTSNPCVARGGSYGFYGMTGPAKYRYNNDTGNCGPFLGFRVGLWK